MSEPFDPIGIAQIAQIKGVPANTVYSWHRRKKLPEADQIVSGIPVWRRAIIEDPAAGLPKLPRLVGPQEVARMFGVKADTVWMWIRRTRTEWVNITLPEPKTNIGRTPMWLPEQWTEFAEKTGRPIDLTVLDDDA